jgi:hypothetical protein
MAVTPLVPLLPNVNQIFTSDVVRPNFFDLRQLPATFRAQEARQEVAAWRLLVCQDTTCQISTFSMKTMGFRTTSLISYAVGRGLKSGSYCVECNRHNAGRVMCRPLFRALAG